MGNCDSACDFYGGFDLRFRGVHIQHREQDEHCGEGGESVPVEICSGETRHGSTETFSPHRSFNRRNAPRQLFTLDVVERPV